MIYLMKNNDLYCVWSAKAVAAAGAQSPSRWRSKSMSEIWGGGRKNRELTRNLYLEMLVYDFVDAGAPRLPKPLKAKAEILRK